MSGWFTTETAAWARFIAFSLGASVLTFWGLGGLVHYHYYVRRRGQASAWKLQPERWLQAGQVRHAFTLGSVNILIGSVLGGTLAWHVARGGWSRLYFDTGRHGRAWLPISAVLGFFLI